MSEEFVTCPRCFMMARHYPPHSNDPCPQQLLADEAYIAMLDAQRMSFIRAPHALADIADAQQRIADDMTGVGE